MKWRLVAVAALLAFSAQAQNVAAPSDSWLCNHGDQSAAATQAACSRLLGGGGAAVTPAPGSATAPAAPSPAGAAPPTTPKALSPPSDVGETSANEPAAAAANADTGDDETAHVSIDNSWLGVLGPLALAAIVFGCFAGLAFYFLPTIIALVRQKRNTLAIFVLNAFLGWTFIGWVASLVWSLSAEPVTRA